MKIKDNEFYRLRDYMQQNYGLNLEKKRTLIEGRLSNHLKKNNFKNFSEYIDYVINDNTGGAVSFLVSRLTTNYTYFMREHQHYTFLKEIVLPEWTAKIKDADLRTWSAGCSSGEEPYTTAMVYDEYFSLGKGHWDTTILATDISDDVLKQAREGIYAAERLEKINTKWRNKYFKRLSDGSYKISPKIIKQVAFRNFNLMEPIFSFKRKFHIIFCRNVMIYFNNKTRASLVQKFYNHLEEGGYLFIAHSETLSNLNTPFTYIQPSIYKKISK